MRLARLTKADLEKLLDDRDKRIIELERRCEALTAVVIEFHPWARRYCDGRMTYVALAFNKAVRLAIQWGVKLHLVDGTPWARDGMGRKYDGLTDEEAALGSLPVTYDTSHDHKEMEDTIYRLRRRIENLTKAA